MSQMKINRRGFIALSAASAAAGLFGMTGPEAWTHHGVLVRVDRDPGVITMSYRADGKTYALAFRHDHHPLNREMEVSLRTALRRTIDDRAIRSAWAAA